MIINFTLASVIPAAISSESPLLKPESLNGQLVRALHDVLEDETFNFDSKPARETREAAVLLLDWTIKRKLLSYYRVFEKPTRTI